MAVGVISCIPWKYPLYDDMIGTMSSASDVAFIDRAAPGTLMSSAMVLLKKNSTQKPTIPMDIISDLESLNTRSASLNCPTAYLSDTILEMATGRPAVANTSRNP